MTVRAIPEGYHSITPYLIVEGAGKLLDFLGQAFGAQELVRMAGPDGKIGHAEVRIGDSHLMLADATPEHPPVAALTHLYVEDRSATRARWFIATHKEDVAPDEMKRRTQAAMRQRG